MPICTFDTLDQIPEPLRSYAKADGDKVQINLVAQEKLDEFRETNITLVKERDELKKKVETLEPIVGEDPTAFVNDLTELRATSQRVKDGQLTDSRRIEEEVIRRTEDMKKVLEDQIRAAQKEGANWKTKATDLESTYKRTLVNTAIKDALIDPELGVAPAAVRDILHRATEVWRAGDDGRVLAYQGDLQLYGADGGSPLTPKEWILKLKDEAPHYFKGTHGGGAAGGGADGGQRGALGKTQAEMRNLSAADKLALANGDRASRL
ncbi:hypothetical protein KIKIMORA_04100 [Brevundimonas phage vB_BpoS-Kikimora]|uniref:Phage protein n=2 Tax=Kikimoravirus TaxID=3425051 RepID=A0A9E7SSW3_9CAUD|nr:hypothetical protein KIKIMORA_04100 [Brevundimonas phage vB_BpoS-Kikimora]UTC28415.1 hypothetical protein GURKE_04130 [Brevundimonas phage vB_BpoS-Gurke]